ncbi:MAG: Bax inhibitor-1 family protein [Pseudomonadota bacterium]
MQTLNYDAVANASEKDRSEFIWKCYAHVVGGLMAFAAVLGYMVQSGIAESIFGVMMNNWLIVMGLFILVSWGASHIAHRVESKAAQYGAYALLVFAEAVIFSPMIWIASQFSGVLDSAIGITLVGCVALIATAMITRKDFSFLRGVLTWGFFLALILIGASIIFGWNLGTWFSVGMIGFAGAAVLYDTSNIMHHYPQDRYVAASMALFASIALMFWYVLQLVLSFTSSD